jgi:sulfatase maturation enzyme AslB (radical SAM superfamily)
VSAAIADLPLFQWERAGHTLFYAPGHACVVGQAQAGWFLHRVASPGTEAAGQAVDWAAELRRAARSAQAQARAWLEGSFEPECLTLYMNNECNLRCAYCHSDPVPGRAPRLQADEIAAAADVVAASCRHRRVHFTAVLHGGGEPTLHGREVEKALDLVQEAAARRGVELFRYVATNGAMSEAKARWLAGRFDLIGLSCDGPPDLQDRQRPGWEGQPTSSLVEQTARVFREEGVSFHVRTTITPASSPRQAEIAHYVCERLRPEEIHFEPVYVGGRTRPEAAWHPAQAEEFAHHFMRARAAAREWDVPLLTSGCRPGAVHGPYCHVYRQVINLVPGGAATVCFKLTEAAQVARKGALVGAMDGAAGLFRIDPAAVAALRRELDSSRPECASCFNRYHCVRDCPDWCPLDGPAEGTATGEAGFRCRAQKAIARAILSETADRLWSEVKSGKAEPPHGTRLA